LSELNQSDQRLTNERGLDDLSPKPRFLVIGRVIKPHGINGEVAAEILTDLPERFSWIETIYLGEDDPIMLTLREVRFHKSRVLLKFEGIDDRDSAEVLRGELLQVPESEAIPLEDNEYFLFQLLGLKVIDNDRGYLGVISDIVETGANNVFVVQGDLGEVLVPDIDQVVKSIDFEDGQIRVDLLPGL